MFSEPYRLDPEVLEQLRKALEKDPRRIEILDLLQSKQFMERLEQENMDKYVKSFLELVGKLGEGTIVAIGQVLNAIVNLVGRMAEGIATNADPIAQAAAFVLIVITIRWLLTTEPYRSILLRMQAVPLLGAYIQFMNGLVNGKTFKIGNNTLTIDPLAPFGFALLPTAPPPGNNTPPAPGGIDTGPPYLTSNQIIDVQGTPFDTQFRATVAWTGEAFFNPIFSNKSPIVEQGADGKFYVTNAKVPNLAIPNSVDLCGPQNDYPGVRGCISRHPGIDTNQKFAQGFYWVVGPLPPSIPGGGRH